MPDRPGLTLRKPDSQEPKLRMPLWAWLFAACCFAIPVVALGGAIPGALGVGGGFYCLAVSREASKSTRTKLVHCSATVAASWILFLAMLGGVAVLMSWFGMNSEQRTQHSSKPHQIETVDYRAPQEPADYRDTHEPADYRNAAEPSRLRTAQLGDQSAEPLDEATRRKIYARATSLLDDIESAKQRQREAGSSGFGRDVARKQLEHIQGMHEDRQDFYANFYEITRAELDEIIAEGDRKRWPRG